MKSRWVRAALGLALAAGCAVAVAAGAGKPTGPDVVGVRFGGSPAETRIVVDLREPARGSVEADASQRLTLLLKGPSAASVMKGEGLGLVRGWTVENAPGGVRLTLDLAQRAGIERRFLLPPADGVATYRYVLDLAAAGGSRQLAYQASASPAAPEPTAAPAQFEPRRRVRARKVIVIDPGHGGKDPGAEGSDSYEKNVTLATALALRDRLEATGRYKVVMTRDTDVYVPLETRVQIARRAGADLFLSLHADSGPDPATHGASVYTLSERGEQRVGYVLGRHEWFLQDARETDDAAVGKILLDLTQRATRNRSASFAQTLIDYVGDKAPLLPRSQRDAGYFVLLAPDVPAALLEMGFITNLGDEARLNNVRDRAALVEKITQAINAYFSDGARLAER